ncbi:type III secretion system LEE cytoprotective effector EspZ [Escherichia coli]|uniref:type III secretion system LEE cytoprotective effector EspZ n=1 Tax=Escherichia coli TaxID=562 RepID=UPI0005B64061|nr:type III secretion system LEE cytoprotective effector EspZ [Escherichia coli]EFE7502554.1 type III secretion system LEE cytoprotective effector EspZ [Escherichia coli]EFL3324855.1 type III secretion system LEE cytoprotective effector EspZ [Escherichia coli]EFO3111771.1 type III secretion system LEE cytoprotective effector EspZ [Escherichia coli]HAW8522317.1 type III secretion system LEE cytoprotective effector EspZ [Escherichia coli]
MEAANLSPSGAVMPLATSLSGNNSVDGKTGVIKPENGTNRTVRVIAGLALTTTALAALGTGIAAACSETSSTEYLALGITSGVLGTLTAVGGALAMKYA